MWVRVLPAQPAPTNWNTSYNISHKWPPLPPQKQVAPVEQLGPNLPFEGSHRSERAWWFLEAGSWGFSAPRVA